MKIAFIYLVLVFLLVIDLKAQNLRSVQFELGNRYEVSGFTPEGGLPIMLKTRQPLLLLKLDGVKYYSSGRMSEDNVFVADKEH